MLKSRCFLGGFAACCLWWLFLFWIFGAFTGCASIDRPVREAVKWEDTTTPKRISDAGVIALPIVAVASAPTWKKRGLAAGALAVNVGLNQGVKHLVGRERPDGSEFVSFYSGHTSTAMTAAGIICVEHSPGACAGATLAAAGVGYLRMAGDKHWLTDVLTGAVIGFATGHYVMGVQW